ncbi:MAG: DUF3784 domain-containing protein [Methanomassiliicoccaceae archaeon]|jgi:flagellar basal body-associated protein FliL|nr:DUF3784 domain-containing protein [Methanomassiliicoccaceae archaeon]
MDEKKALVGITASASLLSPFLVLILSIVIGFEAFSIILMMFITMPLVAVGSYMWITGKGQWMIAGYNTMSKSRQAQYDGEKLAKDLGKVLVIFSLLLLFGTSAAGILPHSSLIFWATMLLIAAILAYFIIRANGPKYKKDPTKGPPLKNEDDKKMLIVVIGISVLVTVIVLVIVFFSFGYGNVTATMDDDGLKVNAPMTNVYIEYDNIVSMELRDNLAAGTRTNGFGGTNVSSGSFRNDAFGNYTLAIYNGVGLYIVVTPTEGKILVFNQNSAEKTMELYELIEKAWRSK